MVKKLSLTFLALCIVLFFNNCAQEIDTLEVSSNNVINDTIIKFKVLALGDSYTIGQGVDISESWPSQLKYKFDSGKSIIEDLKVIAQTGWTTRNLINAIDIDDPNKYDLVTLLIGVNNQYQNRPFDEFITEFDSLLNIAKTFTTEKGSVVLISIPDYGITPFAASNSTKIGEEIDAYNKHIEEEATKHDLAFIDVTSISRELGDSALATDRLHPNAYQYSLWVEEILPIARLTLN